MQQYLELLKEIKERGTKKPAARGNMPGTTSLFGYQFRHDLSQGFPLLTTKRLSLNNIWTELKWFLRGDTNIKYLVDRGCNIWNGDAYMYYKKMMAYYQTLPPQQTMLDLSSKLMSLDFGQFTSIIKNAESERELPQYTDYELGDCGKQYGIQWRSFGQHEERWGIDQIKALIASLKNTPESRRHILTAWNPHDLEHMALHPCHALVQFNCRPIGDEVFEIAGVMYDTWEGDKNVTKEQLWEMDYPKYYLDCQLYQRSADVFLGVPYNIASYAMLTHLLAKMCKMIPGEFIHTFGDVHIYDNHMSAVNEQLSREPHPLPKFSFNEAEDYTGSIDKVIEVLEQLSNPWTLTGYDPHASIKAKLSTGLV